MVDSDTIYCALSRYSRVLIINTAFFPSFQREENEYPSHSERVEFALWAGNGVSKGQFSSYYEQWPFPRGLFDPTLLDCAAELVGPGIWACI